MSLSDIAHYLLSRITLGLLRQEISVTYKSLRNVYLGALGHNQEQDLQSSDNHHQGLPLHCNSRRGPQDLSKAALPWLQGVLAAAPVTLQPSSDKKSKVSLCQKLR